jgi:hypothetical protein
MTSCGSSLSRSLLGVKRISLFAAHISASDQSLADIDECAAHVRFWGKADMAFCKDAEQLLAQSPNNYHPTCLRMV